MMTRKDFKEIASVLRENKAKRDIVHDLARYFYKVNPNFNLTKFVVASAQEVKNDEE